MVEEDMKLAEKLWQKRIFPEPMPGSCKWASWNGWFRIGPCPETETENELILASRDELDLLNQSNVENLFRNKSRTLLLMLRPRWGNSCEPYIPD